MDCETQNITGLPIFATHSIQGFEKYKGLNHRHTNGNILMKELWQNAS